MTLDKLLEEAANRYAMEVLGKTEEDLAYIAPECRPALSRQVKIVAELLYERIINLELDTRHSVTLLKQEVDDIDHDLVMLAHDVTVLESK